MCGAGSLDGSFFYASAPAFLFPPIVATGGSTSQMWPENQEGEALQDPIERCSNLPRSRRGHQQGREEGSAEISNLLWSICSTHGWDGSAGCHEEILSYLIVFM